jgi:hypothetical protein
MTILKEEIRAQIALLRARKLEMIGTAFIEYDESDKILRESLENYLYAFWVFKAQRNSITLKMHKLGKTIHNRFGCQFKFNGTDYYNDCPVDLSHIDFGISWGGEESIICSICGKDPIDCDHIPGRKYDHIACEAIRKGCNICWNKKDECQHILGKYYDNVEAIGITIDMKPTHVAMVSDPACPSARVQARPVSREDIQSIIKNLRKKEQRNFAYGISPLYCHHCCSCCGVKSTENKEFYTTYLYHGHNYNEILWPR